MKAKFTQIVAKKIKNPNIKILDFYKVGVSEASDIHI